MSGKRLFLSTIILTMVATTFSIAQAPANRAATEKQIVANERAINEAIAKGDLKTFHSFIAPDAVSIDPTTGIVSVNTPDFDKLITSAKVQSWNIDGSKFYWVADGSVVHMYRWTGKGSFGGQPVSSPTWSSTVWANRGGKWLAVFHQETNAITPPPAPAGKK